VSTVTSEVVRPRKLRLWWLWWLVGWALLAATVNESLEAKVWLAEVVPSDKLLHCGGYFALATWFAGVTRRSRYLVMGALLIAFGGGLEIAQGLMHNGRTADWFDFLANSVGVVIGVGAAYLGLGNWLVWIEKLVRVRD
jgi:VanZ family protein